jgi:DNA-binding NarL/FixJ family response regulator
VRLRPPKAPKSAYYCTTLSKEAAKAMNDRKTRVPLKLGLVATDPLRILGLQTILGEGAAEGGADVRAVEIVPLSVPGALDASGVSLILIDSACTDHIFELLATFRRTRPHLRLIVLGLEESHDYIQRIIGAGAKGYLAHTAKGNEVRLAIEIVEDGSAWAPRKVLANLVDLSAEERREGSASEPKFTEREAQVLKLLVEGHPNRVIAGKLSIDVATVKKHVGTLMRKVGVKNRIALSVQVVNRNLLPN